MVWAESWQLAWRRGSWLWLETGGGQGLGQGAAGHEDEGAGHQGRAEKVGYTLGWVRLRHKQDASSSRVPRRSVSCTPTSQTPRSLSRWTTAET